MTNLNSTIKMNKKRLRVGRGIGSGKGKTSGRVVKGQKSRSGVAIKSFEGGQMPLFRRLPKRGFNSLNLKKIAKINLEKIQLLVDKKIITSQNELSLKNLQENKIIGKSFKKLKILGNGQLKDKISIETNYLSANAKTKLEKIGCNIIIRPEKK